MFNVLLCFVTLVMVEHKIYKLKRFCAATYNIFYAHILFTASNSSGNNTTYPDGTVVQQPADSGEVAYYVIAGLAIASAVVSGVSVIYT